MFLSSHSSNFNSIPQDSFYFHFFRICIPSVHQWVPCLPLSLEYLLICPVTCMKLISWSCQAVCAVPLQHCPWERHRYWLALKCPPSRSDTVLIITSWRWASLMSHSNPLLIQAVIIHLVSYGNGNDYNDSSLCMMLDFGYVYTCMYAICAYTYMWIYINICEF